MTKKKIKTTPIAKIVCSVLPDGKVLQKHNTAIKYGSIVEKSQLVTFAYGDNEDILGPVSLYGINSSSNARLRDAIDIIKGRQSDLSSKEQACKPILIFPHLTEEAQEYLREVHANYADVSGNAMLNYPGLYIDRRGFSEKTNSHVYLQNDSQQPLRFSDSQSLVIRILLDNDWTGIRELASIAEKKDLSLSVGQASKMVNALKNAGYIERGENGKVRLRRKEELLAEWAGAYDRLKAKESKGFYLLAEDSFALRDRCAEAIGDSAIMTGKAGASYVDNYASFNTVSLLARDIEKAADRLRKIGARPVDKGANIIISSPRYRESAFWKQRDTDGAAVASDLQLYLDLHKEPRRGEEAAEHLYDRFLFVTFEGNKEPEGEGA